MECALKIRNLARPGLSPVSITLGGGECLALRGPSGSGKSLFLRAVADLDPNDGEVVLGAVNRAATPAPDWRRRVAYLHAESGWWADTVAPHFSEWEKARHLIEAFGLSDGVGGWEITRLSTGEKQRLALARTLSLEPDVLLLDEPTSALDDDATLAVEKVLSERLEQGAILVIATHNEAQALRLGARMLAFEGGTAVEVRP